MFNTVHRNEGSRWFRRFIRDCEKISSHIRIVRIKYGFFRIFWDQAYIMECYKEMPQFGHDIYERDVRFEEKKFAEEYEDRAELTRKIKNYVEGYWDSIDRLKTRTWLMQNDKTYHEQAMQAYRQFVIK